MKNEKSNLIIACDGKNEVSLLFASPLWLISNGIRYSHNTRDKSDSTLLFESRDDSLSAIEPSGRLGQKDFALTERVGFKFKHESVLEHSLMTFHVTCSRAVLQELARHRHISLTVKSTRYTLNELKNEKDFIVNDKTKEEIEEIFNRGENYLVYTSCYLTNLSSLQTLENLRKIITDGRSNDIAKYTLPESFRTELQLSMNLREFIHLAKLRLSKDALWEFRDIIYLMINKLPSQYKELIFNDERLLKIYKEYEEAKGIKND